MFHQNARMLRRFHRLLLILLTFNINIYSANQQSILFLFIYFYLFTVTCAVKSYTSWTARIDALWK